MIELDTIHLHPLNFEMSKNMPQLTTIVECLLKCGIRTRGPL